MIMMNWHRVVGALAIALSAGIMFGLGFETLRAALLAVLS